MKKLIAVIFISSIVACKSKKVRCTPTCDDIIQQTGTKTFIPDMVKGHIVEINDVGIDSVKGGAYFFDTSKNLKSYKFFENMKAFTYDEEYDKGGDLTKTTGKPLVDRVIREVNKDSAFIRLYFFSLNKTYQKLNVQINDSLSLDLDLYKDTTYSNMKLASFGLSTRGLRSIECKLKITYKNGCDNKYYDIKDTISLNKNPYLSIGRGS